jgi:threonine synthase
MPLLARYDLDAAKAWRRESLSGREPNMWRYRELMPLVGDEMPVTLGEGFTPLVHAARLGRIERLGWVPRGKRPRMVSVQAEHCAPIIRAFEQGTEKTEMWQNARTCADGLRVPKAIGDFLILRSVRESGGTALAVSDDEMVCDMKVIGAREGVCAAPEGGATLSALRKLCRSAGS